MMRYIVVLFIGAFGFLKADTIVADRPGFSTGTYTVKPDRINIETGYQYSFNRRGIDYSTRTYPQLNIRTGIDAKSEFNLYWDGRNIDKTDNQPSVESYADLSVGIKYRLEENEVYNFTFLGVLSLPTGTAPSTSDHIDPTVALLWDRTLSEKESLFGVVQSSAYHEDNEHIYDLQLAVGYSYNYTQRVGLFIETYTIIPSRSMVNTTSVVDGGITYLLTDNIQLDINGGVGLNANSDDFIGFGLARRF